MICSDNELQFGLPEDDTLIRAIAYRKLGIFAALMSELLQKFDDAELDNEHDKLVDDICCSMRFVGTAFEAFMILKALRPLSGHRELNALTRCFENLREARHQHLIRLAQAGKVKRPLERMHLARLRPGAGKEDVRLCLVYQPEELVSVCTFLATEYVSGRDRNAPDFECEIASWSELVEVYDGFEDVSLSAQFERVVTFDPFIENDLEPPIEPMTEPGEDEIMAKLRARRAMSSVEQYAKAFMNRVLT
jgi:hypothetical protein